jgi:Domain of unknown function (DUF4397)
MGVRRLAAAVSAGLLLPAMAALPAHAQDEVDVTVVHAIPGLTVDVAVDGEVVLDDFTFEGDDNPAVLTLPAGAEFDVEILDETGTDTLLGPVTVVADVALSLVAHLDAEGEATVSEFEDVFPPLCTGEGGVVLRHTAAAPEVDVAVEGTVLGTFANGEELAAALPAGTYEAEVRLAGTDTVAIGPADLEVLEGVATVVYAVGAAADESLELLLIDYEVGTEDCDETPEPTPTKPVATAKPPTAVPAGQGPGDPGSSVAVAAFGLFLLAGFGATMAVVRARRQDT